MSTDATKDVMNPTSGPGPLIGVSPNIGMGPAEVLQSLKRHTLLFDRIAI
jgi:hypothetical protein